MNFRVSTARQYESYRAGIGAANTRMFEAQARVATGKKLNKPSDDPLGASRVLNMRTLRAGLEQYRSNATSAKGVLGHTEVVLSEISTLLNRAYGLAVSGANGATDQPSRNAMATEVEQIQARLIELANSKGPSGQYLFAGQSYDARPFTLSGTTLNYVGDGNDVVMEIGPGDMMATHTKGEALIGEAYSRLGSLKAALLGGDTGYLSGVSITDVQASIGAFNTERGQVGAKLRTVEDGIRDMTRRMDELTASISDVEEIDLDRAIVDYQLAQTAYSAALNVASQGFRLSLMDFIQG